MLTRGLSDLLGTGFIAEKADCLLMLADAYRGLGKPEDGFMHLAEAKRVADATQVRRVVPEILHLQGDLLAVTGDRNGAEASLREAIYVAQRQRAKLFELRAAASLARLWRDQGRTADAHDLLAPIYRWFTEGFDAPDLVEAKALLDQ